MLKNWYREFDHSGTLKAVLCSLRDVIDISITLCKTRIVILPDQWVRVIEWWTYLSSHTILFQVLPVPPVSSGVRICLFSSSDPLLGDRAWPAHGDLFVSARAVIVARVRLSDQTETSKVLEESSFQYYSTAFRCPEIFLVSHFLLFRSFFPSSSFSQPAKKNQRLS